MPHALDREELLPAVAFGGVRMPRPRSGAAPQSLAVVLLAELGLAPRAWFPSAVLADLLHDLGTTEAGARAVVRRLARRGVLEGRRSGRRTEYRLTEAAAVALARGGRAQAAFPRRAEEWDGRWTLVAFSAPQDAGTERSMLRARLRWRGFAPLYDGVWVSPQEPGDLVETVVAETATASLTVFRAEHLPVRDAATRDPADVWDLDAVGEQYAAFLAAWTPELARARAGAVQGADALRGRVAVADDYRRFVVLDPRLPVRLMPRGWPRAAARRLCADLFDALADPTLDHVRAVAARHGTTVDVRLHTLDDLADGRVVVAAERAVR